MRRASSALIVALLAVPSCYLTHSRSDGEGAALHFVVVTDDDSELSADDFLEAMNKRLGRSFIVHAIASPNVDGAPCRNPSADCATAEGRSRALCGASAIGTQYYALAERLGGQQISICIDDWSMVFGPLLDAAVDCTELR